MCVVYVGVYVCMYVCMPKTCLLAAAVVQVSTELLQEHDVTNVPRGTSVTERLLCICYAMPCYAMLCYAMPCYAMLYYVAACVLACLIAAAVV